MIGPRRGDQVRSFGIGRVYRPEPDDDRDARAAPEPPHRVACMRDRVRVHVRQANYLDAVQVQAGIGSSCDGLERCDTRAETTSFEQLGKDRCRHIVEIATSPGAQHRAILPVDARLDPLRQSRAWRCLFLAGLGDLVLPTGVLVFRKIVDQRQGAGGDKRAALIGQNATGTIVLEHRERRYRDLLEVCQD